MVELGDGFLLQARQDMGIGIQRDGDGGMAKALAHHLGVDTLDEQLGGMGHEAILRRLSEPKSDIGQIIIDTELIIRGSTVGVE